MICGITWIASFPGSSYCKQQKLGRGLRMRLSHGFACQFGNNRICNYVYLVNIIIAHTIISKLHSNPCQPDISRTSAIQLISELAIIIVPEESGRTGLKLCGIT